MDRMAVAREELARDGFTVIRGLLNQQTLETAKGLVRRAAQNVGIDDIFDPAVVDRIDQETWGKVRIASHYRLSDEFEEVYCGPDLLEAASLLLGTAAKLFPVHKLRISAPDREFTTHPWHQDEATWPAMLGRNPISVWAPLVPVDERNGLALVPRAYDRLFEHEDQDGFLAVSDNSLVVDEHMPKLQPGDAIVFSCFTVHRSIPNRSEGLRLSLDFRYQAASNP